MSVCLFIVDRCGDEIVFDRQSDVEEWYGCFRDINGEFESWMKIGYEINKFFKFLTWKRSSTNDVIYVGDKA